MRTWSLITHCFQRLLYLGTHELYSKRRLGSKTPPVQIQVRKLLDKLKEISYIGCVCVYMRERWRQKETEEKECSELN